MTTIQQFDFSINLLRVLLWQYDNAPKLKGILGKKNIWYQLAQTEFWENWFTDVFNLTTASEFGCVVWGIILGVPLSAALDSSGERPVFGFGQYNKNYDNGNFGRDAGSVALLTLEQKRQILQLRYFQLISDGTVPSINYALKTVFGGGYVLDGLDMTGSYVLDQAIPFNVQRVIDEYDLLPRPAGVMLNKKVSTIKVFGFGPENSNYDNSQFGES